VVAPQFAPVFGGVGTSLKFGETISNKLKNKRI
jgi:hypothetical protein